MRSCWPPSDVANRNSGWVAHATNSSTLFVHRLWVRAETPAAGLVDIDGSCVGEQV
jgi:hypothetical protein